jgi:hypothetical protein
MHVVNIRYNVVSKPLHIGILHYLKKDLLKAKNPKEWHK